MALINLELSTFDAKQFDCIIPIRALQFWCAFTRERTTV